MGYCHTICQKYSIISGSSAYSLYCYLAGILATSFIGCDSKTESKGTAGGKVNVEIIGVQGEGFTPFENCESLKEIETKSNLSIKWIDWS